jgi:hypothetical protein
MDAMLGHHKRFRLRQIKHLTGVVIVAGCLRQRFGAVCATCGKVIDGVVGIVDRAKRFPRVAFCPPAGFFDRSRRLRVRGGFLLNPSLDGGLLLFELFSPRRRSNSVTRANSAAFSRRIVWLCASNVARSLASAAFCAISRSRLACKIAIDVRPHVASDDGSGNTKDGLGRCHRSNWNGT